MAPAHDGDGGPVPEVPAALVAALAEVHAGDAALAAELTDLEETLRKGGLAEAASDVEQLRRTTLLGGVGRRLGGLADSLREVAARQWRHFVAELEESREAMSLLRRRLGGEITAFSPDEEDLVRGQVADLFRMVPATALALAPVPGMAVLTPFVLKRLNLLPSAWREANLTDRLQQTAHRLADRGENEQAQRIVRTIERLDRRRSDRDDRIRTLREHPTIRLLYDLNMDGVIDGDEWALIESDRDALRRLAREDSTPRWYFTTSGEVEGPVALDALFALPLPDETLVHAHGLERWVPLDFLLVTLRG